jgi:hypothetical protein
MSTRNRIRVVLAPLLAAILLSAGVGSASTAPHVRVVVSPRVVAPYDWATIGVSGLSTASSVEVRLVGASGVRGTPLPWTALHRRAGVWQARLPQPVFAGIYPIRIRTRPALAIAPAEAGYLRVYWQGTERRPLFRTPQEAAAWWVRHATRGTLVAIRRWPGTAIDHRLVRLHRLFVVAYSPPGTRSQASRLGAWVTAVREGDTGEWRVLETSVTPP